MTIFGKLLALTCKKSKIIMCTDFDAVTGWFNENYMTLKGTVMEII